MCTDNMKNKYSIGVITASDKASIGEREDVSGACIIEIMKKKGYWVTNYSILPDDVDMLANEMKRLCDIEKVDLILTTGGTGLSKRDCTPEATLSIAHRQVPGIAEAIRSHSLSITKRSMLSRGISVVRENTLIINLPGSPKAVTESLQYIVSELEHGLGILKGHEVECGGKDREVIK